MTSVGIIGAGPSGLVSAKSALECKLTPTIFEKNSNLGGVWSPKTGSTWDNMKTNISYHSCMFSDFPWKDNREQFPNQKSVYDYLYSYAKEFNLEKHIQFNAQVIKVSNMEDKWKVEWSKNGENESKIFDFLIVCSGIFSLPLFPKIERLDSFKGIQIHSKDYKNPEAFRSKRILIVGNAFSGSEIASEIATVANRVVNCIQRPLWVLPRVLSAFSGKERELPGDMLFYERSSKSRNQGVKEEIVNQRKYAWFKSVSKQEEICPELKIEGESFHPQFVTISDSYLKLVREEKIKVKKTSISSIENSLVQFEDGSQEEIDALVFCTGYRVDLPFFDTKILGALEFKQNDSLQPFLLHKTVFHPSLTNAAFVGMYRGPFFGIMELQARWVTMVFSKIISGPSRDQMIQGIDKERMIRQTIPRCQFPHGNYVEFADDLAHEIACLPDFDKIRNEFPDLYAKLWEGPLTPPHYRLTGFGNKRELALELIEKTYEIFKTGISSKD